MASAKLRAFFSGLATDPEKLGAFMGNPDAALAAADLDEEDKVAVLSGAPAALRARLHVPDEPPPGEGILYLVPDLELRPSRHPHGDVRRDFAQAFAQAFSQAFSQGFARAFAQAFGQTFPSAFPDANADTRDADAPTDHPDDRT